MGYVSTFVTAARAMPQGSGRNHTPAPFVSSQERAGVVTMARQLTLIKMCSRSIGHQGTLALFALLREHAVEVMR